LEYICESEHQDGDEFLDNFSTLGEMMEDFTIYQQEKEE
jgi:hypothetical protein